VATGPGGVQADRRMIVKWPAIRHKSRMRAANPLVRAVLVAGALMGSAQATQAAAQAGQPATAAPARRLIGLHVTGPQAERDLLKSLAVKSGIPNQEMSGPEGPQLVISFPPASNPSAVRGFIGQLSETRFANLRFRPTYAPAR
jgi:hypothetical protein